MNWDDIWFQVCAVIAQKSKDNSTKIGCVIVGVDNETIATGYNSFPRGINDNLPERQERPEKYYWFEHAERNAIYNAARIGVSTKGATLYVPYLPCMDCARAIIQSGISEVKVRHRNLPMHSEFWSKDKFDRTVQIFKEAGIKLTYIYDKY